MWLSLNAADWPQWRGPGRDGHIPAAEPPLASLPAEARVIWKMPAGTGLASPVVAGDRVAVFDHAGGQEVLRVLNRKTGAEMWRAEVDATFTDAQSPPGPRCTPVIDGDTVFVQSGRGELQCRRLADGQLVWRTRFTDDFGAVFIGERGNTPGAARHGNTGSPLVHGGHLIASVGGLKGAGIVCFDKNSGRVVWKSLDEQAAYAAPILARIGEADQVVDFMVRGVFAVNPASGRLLWHFPMETAYARHVTTPVVWKDRVAVASHQAGLVGIRVVRNGEDWAAEQAWLNQEAAMNYASPVRVGEHLYGLGPRRNIICVSLQTGEIAWSQEGYFQSAPDKAHAGFLVSGNHLLMLADSGELVLFGASPAGFQEKGRLQVCGFNWCNPAYADGQLFLRDQKEFLCVQLR
jgi:outer membrane protein assembly factor BamB